MKTPHCNESILRYLPLHFLVRIVFFFVCLSVTSSFLYELDDITVAFLFLYILNYWPYKDLFWKKNNFFWICCKQMSALDLDVDIYNSTTGPAIDTSSVAAPLLGPSTSAKLTSLFEGFIGMSDTFATTKS